MTKHFPDYELECNIDIPLSISYNSSNELLKDIVCGNRLVDITENTLYQVRVK